MCCEGLPTSFYSLDRSVPVRIKYGNIWEPPNVDKTILIAKARVIWRQHGAGRPCGSAGPRVSPPAPPFVLDTAKWAPNLCMLVPGLCLSVFSVKWAHFVGETWDEIFCVFFSVFTCVFLIFHQWVPADHNSPKLLELVIIKPYN